MKKIKVNDKTWFLILALGLFVDFYVIRNWSGLVVDAPFWAIAVLCIATFGATIASIYAILTGGK